MSTVSKRNSQFYIFNLFGNFIEPRDRPVWTNELLQLLATLGVEEKTARSTLARMRQKGWLTVEKVGRQSRYGLSPSGLKILEEGDARIFEKPPEAWNGRWHLITYSLPDSMTHQRNVLAKRVRWAGYGNLNRGTWVSATDRSAQLLPLFDELDVSEYVTIFAGANKIGGMTDSALVANCWDLDELKTAYDQFLEMCLAAQGKLGAQNPPNDFDSAKQAFQDHFWLSQQFQDFPRRDPNLPPELLPDDWVGYQARQLFSELRQLLEGEIRPFLAQIFK